MVDMEEVDMDYLVDMGILYTKNLYSDVFLLCNIHYNHNQLTEVLNSRNCNMFDK